MLGRRKAPTKGWAWVICCMYTGASSGACSTASTMMCGTRRSIGSFPCTTPRRRSTASTASRRRCAIVSFSARTSSRSSPTSAALTTRRASTWSTTPFFTPSPEPAINAHFWHLKHFLNDNPDCHLEVGFDAELSHLIYAGADMILLPSLFEPCGLAQMIALKYGTVPIVRTVGGLVDTVFDRDHSDRPYSERNGYVFQHIDNMAVESALDRAIDLWYSHPPEFR